MAQVSFTPIILKLPVTKDPTNQISREMKALGANVTNRMKKYPPQQSKVNRSGRSVAYRRTGTLGRNWTYKFASSRGGFQVDVTNPVPYAGFVQGDKGVQVNDMNRRGWVSIEDVGMSEWRKTLPKIQRIFEDATKSN